VIVLASEQACQGILASSLTNVCFRDFKSISGTRIIWLLVPFAFRSSSQRLPQRRANFEVRAPAEKYGARIPDNKESNCRHTNHYAWVRSPRGDANQRRTGVFCVKSLKIGRGALRRAMTCVQLWGKHEKIRRIAARAHGSRAGSHFPRVVRSPRPVNESLSVVPAKRSASRDPYAVSLVSRQAFASFHALGGYGSLLSQGRL
jgi:hypothetical protein